MELFPCQRIHPFGAGKPASALLLLCRRQGVIRGRPLLFHHHQSDGTRTPTGAKSAAKTVVAACRRLIKKAIPRAVFEKCNAVRSAQGKAPSQTAKTAEIGEDYKKQFTLDQLEYRPDNLDAAMNLMAICTDDKNLFETVWPKASANK
jgi:hypothetical protein